MYNPAEIELKNIPIRPLNKGMIRNVPSTMLPTGSFLRLQNYRVNPYGLSRRGGLRPLVNNTGTSYRTKYNERLYDMIYYWAAIDNPEMLVIGSEHMYHFNALGDLDTVYPNIGSPETSYTIVSAEPYDTDLEITELVISMTVDQYSRLVNGDDFYYVTGGNEHYLGEIVSKVYDSTSGEATLKVQTPAEGVGEIIYRFPYTFSFSFVASPASGDIVYIREKFVNDPKMNTNYTILPPSTYGDSGKLIIADQAGRGMYEYVNEVFQTFETESSVSGISTDPQYLDSASIVCYMNDRLFVGNTVEQGKLFGQRIRWSDPVNFSRFQPANYIDLPYSRGKLLKLLPLGPLLVAYFEDTVYLGRPSNNVNLPFVFERLETGSSGLVSQHAVVAWNDSHYFVSRDDIYKISITGGIESIKSPLLEETLFNTRDLDLMDFIQVEHDPDRGDIVFLFPNIPDSGLPVDGVSTRLWRYNYLTEGWTYDEVNFADDNKSQANFYYSGLLASKFYISSNTWEEWQDGTNPVVEPPSNDPATYEATGERWMPQTFNPADALNPDADIYFPADSFYDEKSWEALKSESLKSYKLYPTVYTSGKVQVISEEFEDNEVDFLGEYDSSTLEEVKYPIWSVMETPDFDFGAPEKQKTATRLSIKTFNNDLRELDEKSKVQEFILNFDVYGSDRMGFRWKRPAILRMHQDYNEGHADFRVTGTNIRFKIINNQDVPSYKINELVVRAALQGVQIEN